MALLDLLVEFYDCLYIKHGSTIQEYLPSQLLNSMSLLLSTTYPSDYLVTILIVLLTSIMSIGLSLVIFNKKAILKNERNLVFINSDPFLLHIYL